MAFSITPPLNSLLFACMTAQFSAPGAHRTNFVSKADGYEPRKTEFFTQLRKQRCAEPAQSDEVTKTPKVGCSATGTSFELCKLLNHFTKTTIVVDISTQRWLLCILHPSVGFCLPVEMGIIGSLNSLPKHLHTMG